MLLQRPADNLAAECIEDDREIAELLRLTAIHRDRAQNSCILSTLGVGTLILGRAHVGARYSGRRSWLSEKGRHWHERGRFRNAERPAQKKSAPLPERQPSTPGRRRERRKQRTASP